MGTQITFRRGSNDPTSGSGITLAEPVFNTNLHTFHIGLGYGITAAWVGAPISGLSADIAAGITYKIPTAKAVKDYVVDYVTAVNGVLTVNGFAGGVTLNAGAAIGVTGLSGNITITNTGVQSFNGATGAVQGVSAAVAGDGIAVSGATGAVTITNTGVTRAIAGTGISVSGATGAVTITNIGVQSFNGNTGAVTGASLGANTFTGLNTFNAGITTAFIYASTGSTFGGTLKVVGGATFDSTTDHAGVARFAAGLTTSSLDVSGAARFANGLTSSGDIRFSGTATKNIRSTQAPIVIIGITSGAAVASNSITLPVDNSALLLGSASGNVNIVNNLTTAAIPGLRILTDDQDFTGAFGTVIKPGTYATAERTQTLQDASGVIALTSQLMGAVNGSTAATTAVTSFNGRTGAVQGVSAAVAGTGISVSGATGAVTITNIGVQSFNGATGAVTGASLGANTFTGLNSFNAGVSASNLYVSYGITFNGLISSTDPLYFNLNSDSFNLLNLSGSIIQLGWTAGANINISNDGESAIRLYGDTVTTTGIFSGITANFTGLVSSTVGFSGSGANLKGIVTSFNGLSGAVQGVSAAVGSTYLTVSGSTGSVTFTNTGVQTFNGLTGAVTGVTAGGANTFTALNTFNAGISAAGGVTLAGTFSGTTGSFSRLTTFNAGLSGHINISETNATGNMYLLMARGTGVTAVFADITTTPLVYQPFLGNLGVKGISLANGNDRLYITPTEITATNTVTPSDAYFYFIAQGGNYFQSQKLSAMGDIGAVNSALTLNVDPSLRTMTWSDGIYLTGVTSGFFGVNRSPSGMCADYAVEINSPTGKGIQLMYNDYTGAASNWVNMDVSSGGNYTLRPSGGLATVTGTLNVSAGVCAAGATFSGLLSASAGISAGGTTAATFNGTVDMNFNTLFEPTLRYYNEVLASPAISANVLTLDLSTAQMFTVSLNANITTFTITNTPATANRSIGFTLIFTADGTARTVTWGAAVKWANNDPPALTSTNGKKDILSFVSPDGGTNWYGFIGGLNF